MTDYILSSNEVSPMIQGFLANVEDLSYNLPKSFPGIVRKIERLNPASSATASTATQGETYFNVPRTMFWDGALVEHVCTLAGTAVAKTFPGKTLGALYEISSNNKVIWRITDAGLLALYADLPSHKMQAIDRLAMPMDANYAPITAGTPTSYRCFTYLPASFFETVRLSLELSKTEQLTVRVQYNSNAGVGIAADTTVTPVLWCYKHTMDKKNYDLILASNSNKPGGLQLMQISNNFEEGRTITTGATSTTVKLSNNFPVHKTHFFVAPTVRTWNATTGNLSYAPITSFSFQIAGQEVFTSSVPTLVTNFDSKKFVGRVGLLNDTEVRVEPSRGVITIDWGLLGDSRYQNSGCVSFSQLNNPTLVVNYGSLTPADNTVYVAHEYWQQVAKDGTGTMQVVLAQ